MTDAVAVEPRPVLPVAGTDAVFPVRRVYCIGRNYAAHAREMGADPTREPPFFFTKPADAIVLCADPKNPTRSPIRRRPRTCTTRWSWWSA